MIVIQVRSISKHLLTRIRVFLCIEKALIKFICKNTIIFTICTESCMHAHASTCMRQVLCAHSPHCLLQDFTHTHLISCIKGFHAGTHLCMLLPDSGPHLHASPPPALTCGGHHRCICQRRRRVSCNYRGWGRGQHM